MRIQYGTRLAEVLETCRPAPPDKPNILKTLLAVQSSLGHVPTSDLSQIAEVLGVTDAKSSGSCPIIETSGFSRLAGILFESAGENPVRRTMACASSVRYKITYASLLETERRQRGSLWNRCPARVTALCRRP